MYVPHVSNALEGQLNPFAGAGTLPGHEHGPPDLETSQASAMDIHDTVFIADANPATLRLFHQEKEKWSVVCTKNTPTM